MDFVVILTLGCDTGEVKKFLTGNPAEHFLMQSPRWHDNPA